MSFAEGNPFNGVIKDIKPVSELGGKGNFKAAIIVEDGSNSDSWYPLRQGQEFTQGEKVQITPQIERHPSGGSVIKYKIVTKPQS